MSEVELPFSGKILYKEFKFTDATLLISSVPLSTVNTLSIIPLLFLQACTGIENFEECLAHLEQNDWNLTGAINSVFGAQGESSSGGSGGGGGGGGLGGQDESGIRGRSAFQEIPMEIPMEAQE